jgi:hypothetical protein
MGRELSTHFLRYAPDDPLCCPSLPAVVVQYRIDRTPTGPVLVMESKQPVNP